MKSDYRLFHDLDFQRIVVTVFLHCFPSWWKKEISGVKSFQQSTWHKHKGLQDPCMMPSWPTLHRQEDMKNQRNKIFINLKRTWITHCQKSKTRPIFLRIARISWITSFDKWAWYVNMIPDSRVPEHRKVRLHRDSGFLTLLPMAMYTVTKHDTNLSNKRYTVTCVLSTFFYGPAEQE